MNAFEFWPARAATVAMATAVWFGIAPAGAGAAAAVDHPASLLRQPGVIKREFIAEPPPTRSSHASTLVETPQGVLAAWFGGPYERHPEVVIWLARLEGDRWTAPVQIVDGIQADGKRYPCWNPVLFQPARGPLLLFYKVGPSPDRWWGMLMTSADNGRTWSTPVRLPDGQVGPVRNKPVRLADGSLLCGASSEDAGWRVHMERTPDLGRTWERTGALNQAADFGAIQPTILAWKGGRNVQILNRSRQGAITECWMEGDWRHWSPMRATALPNPNSAIDAVMLRNRCALLVYNHTRHDRSPINVALSRNGRDWRAAVVLEDEPGEFSYPAVIQTRDGRVHLTYTWKRERIRHVVLDPARFKLRPIVDGQWPNPTRGRGN